MRRHVRQRFVRDQRNLQRRNMRVRERLRAMRRRVSPHVGRVVYARNHAFGTVRQLRDAQCLVHGVVRVGPVGGVHRRGTVRAEHDDDPALWQLRIADRDVRGDLSVGCVRHVHRQRDVLTRRHATGAMRELRNRDADVLGGLRMERGRMRGRGALSAGCSAHARLRQLRDAIGDMHRFVYVGRVVDMRRAGRVRAGCDAIASVRQLRVTVVDVYRCVHLGRVGNVRRAGRVRARIDATGFVRPVQSSSVQQQLRVGRVRARFGQRVQLPERHQ